MITLSIVGSGNVAFHLISALKEAKGIQLTQVCARNPERIKHLIGEDKIVSTPDALQPVDLCIITVSDKAIPEISEAIPFQQRLVAHTSGSVSIKALSDKNYRAVFYPLQTFSVDKTVDFEQIPICLEAERAEDLDLLEEIASSISKSVYHVDSEQRKALHIAAVFVNNFVNQLYRIGFDICQSRNIPFDILKPLILETADKIRFLTPAEAQTGPAKRKDEQTIATHLAALNDQQQKAIYTLMTQTIQSK